MNFENQKVLEAWLNEQTQDVCVAIATRAALRVWPFIVGQRFWNEANKARAVQEKLALATGRAMLTSGVAALGPTPDVRQASYAASFDARAAASDAAAYTDYAARAADYAARATARATARAAYAYAADAVAAYTADAALPLEKMLRTPLWHDTGPPEGLRPGHICNSLLDTNPNFAFLKRWYDGMVEGRPLPAELLRRVVTEIPRETWNGGAGPVAREIARIEAQFDVEQAVADLRPTQAMAGHGNRHGLGGNFPPEELEAEAQEAARASETLIWAIDEINAETKKADPDKDRVVAALAALKDAFAVCLRWAARKADLALDTTIRWVVPASGAGYALRHPEKVETLVRAVDRWLPFLN